jgi:hypothetical protein
MGAGYQAAPSLVPMKEVQGKPDPKEDWHRDPKTGETIDVLAFARLANWRRLQELAGMR